MDFLPRIKSILPWTALRAFLLILLMSVRTSTAARFLLPKTSLTAMHSHFLALTPITKALIDRGHHVTLLLLDKKGTSGFVPGAYSSNITIPHSMTGQEVKDVSEMLDKSSSNSLSLSKIWDGEVSRLLDLYNYGCSELFKNKDILEKLKKEDIDMMITTPVTDACDPLIAAYLSVPFIAVTVSRRTPFWHEGRLGVPTPLSYVPFSFLLNYSDRMDFSERLMNFVVSHTIHPLIEYVIAYRPVAQLQALHGIRPDLNPWEILNRGALWLCHWTLALEYPQPTAPNWIPIPGATPMDTKPLPAKLRDFVEGSRDGFIVFSLGSGTTAFDNQTVTDTIAKVFSKLPQRVVWRYVGPKPRYLGNNTLILNWLPQTDLLAHPSVRLLIYHGGSGGVHEAINFGVPMLLFPLGRDQPTNAKRVAAKGIGISLQIGNLDEKLLTDSLHQLLQNNSYKENAMRASAILRDRMASPLDTAVFWIEHVVKFGGDHLRLRATEMGFIQLHSLDVIVFLVVVVVAWSYLSYVILAACCRSLCKRNKSKISKTKKD
ncbi:UDP-glucuronosyltransferase 1A9-like [Diadema antillarum]|uniref:UDP-glucuronosyltransferase 1A9-like n=1 Tax=Diadema antillarum TaxID=105358 RepID=UPI003A8385B5